MKVLSTCGPIIRGHLEPRTPRCCGLGVEPRPVDKDILKKNIVLTCVCARARARMCVGVYHECWLVPCQTTNVQGCENLLAMQFPSSVPLPPPVCPTYAPWPLARARHSTFWSFSGTSASYSTSSHCTALSNRTTRNSEKRTDDARP